MGCKVPQMKSVCTVLVLALGLGLGCQRGETSGASASVGVGPSTNEYAADIAALCDSVRRSGADELDVDARVVTIASWLGANLKTEDSRKFLVHIQPLTGEPKAVALESEARRVGLSGCALAAEWRVPAAVN
jgi:hypothetical protein